MNSSLSRMAKPQPVQTKNLESKSPDNDSIPNSPLTPTNSSPPNSADEEVRIVFLGSAKVGKTSIIQRFLHNHFDAKYIPTVEDIHLKKFVVRNHLIRLVLMDTAGSYDFPAMLRLCIGKANAFVLVFAHDNPDSLAQAGRLLGQIKSQRKDYAPLCSDRDSLDLTIASPPIAVVCNKSDLPNSDSQVTEGAIMEWLLTNGLKPSQFVYASAKENESILSIFESLWSQNTVSKAIKLVPWDGGRRASLNTQQTRIPSSTFGIAQKETDFSALSGAVPGGTNSTNSNPSNSMSNNNESQSDVPNSHEKLAQKSRTGLFRNSLRLNRRSSSKSNKCKPDLVQLDCVIS